MKNWKVSTKLIAVLIPPLLVLVILAGFGIQERRTDAANANRAEDLTEVALHNSQLTQALQIEAVFSAANMASGGVAIPTELEEQRAKTDEALADLDGLLSDFDLSGESEEFQQAVKTAQTRLDDLPTVRSAVDGRQMSVQNATATLSETADALLNVNAEISQASETPELSDALGNYVEFSGGKQSSAETLAAMVAVANRVGADGAPLAFFVDSTGLPCGVGDGEPLEECAEWTEYQDSLAQEAIQAGRFESRATAEQKSLARNATSAEEVRVADGMLEGLDVAALASSPFQVSNGPVSTVQASQEKLVALHAVEGALVTDIVDEAIALSNTASDEMRVFIIVAVVAILASIVLALVVARAIVGPLQRLTAGANKLSTEQLPGLVEQLRNPDEELGTTGLSMQVESIDIHSKDEIGQLADAFNTIQQVTVDVAEEQAALLRKGIGDIFINLARRNQTLLDRQIEFIDQLEAHEEDPDQLDNLFKLDHLATRMRRNAESLLVLAGAEPPRRRGRPVALADVVRVAIGEVEDFARISLVALDEARVGGNVAVDLAHLLSELMENATHFSPPDTHVEVAGRIESDGTYTITVEDQGIGMSQEQLAEANDQLNNPPLVGLSLSRSLGFIVIGRLAQRFRVRVNLITASSGGIAAEVSLPTDIVTDEEGQPLPTEGAGIAELAEAPLEADMGTHGDTIVVEEIIEEVIVTDFVDGDEVGDEVDSETVVVEEVVEEIIVEVDDGDGGVDVEAITDDATDEPEPATFEQAVPEGDAFDRGLESLLDEEAEGADAASMVDDVDTQSDDVTVDEPVSEPAVAGDTATLDARVPASAPPTDGDITAAGLVKRTPKKRAEGATGSGPLRTATTTKRPTGQTTRSPEEVRKMLSRYRGGLKRGRDGADSSDES